MDTMRTSTSSRPSTPWLPALAAVAACLLAPLAAAQQVPTVLGYDGTVFRLYQGLYGDLFGEGAGADADSPVLALDVRRSDGSSERMLVPGTETSDLESSASMVFEDKTGVVYLAWETLFNGQHSLLQLTSFNGAEWSELIEITSNIFANKSAPQLVVQREADQITEDGTETRRSRTTLHLTWWEESVDVSRKLHALIILEEGQYLGWAPILDLGDYMLEGDASAPPEVPGLENALRLQAGRNHRIVVSGFVHPLTHRLITLEIEALSQVIGDIAEKIRAQIVVIGVNAESHAELAQMARAEVLDQGTAFHEAARNYLADEVAANVEQAEEDLSLSGVQLIGEKIRAQIVVIGLKIGPGGLAKPGNSDIIAAAHPTDDSEPQHYYQVTVVSDREAPDVGGPAELMLSNSGQNVIVTWEEEGQIVYRETLIDGWSEPIAIELTGELDRETVYRMLSERVRAD